MHQHVVADGIAFRVQALQNAQRPLMLEAGHAAIAFVRVVQL
jgi:hypothetical protein